MMERILYWVICGWFEICRRITTRNFNLEVYYRGASWWIRIINSRVADHVISVAIITMLCSTITFALNNKRRRSIVIVADNSMFSFRFFLTIRMAAKIRIKFLLLRFIVNFWEITLWLTTFDKLDSFFWVADIAVL